MKKNLLITGSASGIGLAFVNFYLASGWHVIACARQSSEELNATAAEVIDGIDVSFNEVIDKLKTVTTGRSIDLVINCAGILLNETLENMNFDGIERQWQINTLGPLRVVHGILDSMTKGAKIAMITSRMGSIADNTSGSRYGYRMSKAALNAASKSLAEDLKPKGIAVAILHPGLVATKMIGFHGDLTADEAAQRLSQRIEELNMSNTGTFWHSNGEILPW